MNPFSRHPVDGHHKNVCLLSGLYDLFLRLFRSRIKFQGELPADIQRPAAVLNCLNAAQTNDAPNRQRPISLFSVPFIHRREADLIAALHQIDFQSLLRAMEIQPAVLLVVELVQRNRVRISVFTMRRLIIRVSVSGLAAFKYDCMIPPNIVMLLKTAVIILSSKTGLAPELSLYEPIDTPPSTR